MAQQTAVEWVLQYLNNVKPNEFCSIEKIKELLEQAKEMHKVECIAFAEQWEIRCNEKNMDSKEQLYDETFNK
jgi:hypothetical protein